MMVRALWWLWRAFFVLGAAGTLLLAIFGAAWALVVMAWTAWVVVCIVGLFVVPFEEDRQ